MSRPTVLRVMFLGFGLMVLLVAVAACIGYQSSRSIQQNARDLVREHLVDSKRGAVLEAGIERESRVMLGELVWILGACFLLAAGGAALTIHVMDRAFRQLQWQTEELDRVSWRLVDSHESVARRFSHEMHDELGQALVGIKGMVARAAPPEIEARRGEILGLLDEVMTGVRELSQLLRPVILDDFGLDAGLRWLTERFAQRTRIAVDYQSNFNGRMEERLETHFFRIAQEALTNIARHSGASRAWLRLEMSGGRVKLEIEDNGCGLAAGAPAHSSLGMVGMRARARHVNGELTVENRGNGGLRVRVIAPFEGRNEDGGQEDSDSAG